MTASLKICPKENRVIHVTGSLRAPASRGLRHAVRVLLRNGARRIVLDLSAVSRVDAAGVGELIRAFNMTAAVSGVLLVVNATGWVRDILERANLYDLLTGQERARQRLA